MSARGLRIGLPAEFFAAGVAPDVARAFANNAEAVNEALRLVIRLTKVLVGKKHQIARP